MQIKLTATPASLFHELIRRLLLIRLEFTVLVEVELLEGSIRPMRSGWTM